MYLALVLPLILGAFSVHVSVPLSSSAVFVAVALFPKFSSPAIKFTFFTFRHMQQTLTSSDVIKLIRAEKGIQRKIAIGMEKGVYSDKKSHMGLSPVDLNHLGRFLR